MKNARCDSSRQTESCRCNRVSLPYPFSVDWNDVRYFLALSRLGSVRAAAAALGVSHSTVGRRVEALEIQLAARLFDRSRDGFTLTRAGEMMVPGAERVEREMAALELELTGQDERLAGQVRITCCDQFVAQMMLQNLTVFCGAYPDIDLSITTDSRSYDLTKGEADIAVRTLGVGSAPPEHLIGRKLVGIFCANYVATTHAHRLDPALANNQSRWIAFSERRLLESMVASSSYPHLPIWGSFSSLALLVQATHAGLGISILPCYVADQDSALRRLEKPDVQHVADLWLLSHPDLRGNKRFRATRECIAQALTRQAPLFEAERVSDLVVER